MVTPASPLGRSSLPRLRSRAMCHPEEFELQDVKPGWRHRGPVAGTNSEIGPSAPLLQQTVLAASADRAGCAPGRIARLVMEVSSPPVLHPCSCRLSSSPSSIAFALLH